MDSYAAFSFKVACYHYFRVCLLFKAITICFMFLGDPVFGTYLFTIVIYFSLSTL